MKIRTKKPHRQVPRALSGPEYERARNAYIATGTVTAVALAVPCDRERAHLLIEEGYPEAHQASLKDAARVYAAESEARTQRAVASREAKAKEHEAEQATLKLEARARASEVARRHEEAVLGDAAKSRKDEVSLVRANRVSALVLAQVNAHLLKLSSGLAQSLLEEEHAIRKLSPEKRLGILRTVAGIVQRTADASRISVNMERLLLGEPTAILGREGPSTADMSAEEAEQWLEIANRAFSRRAQRRTLIETDATPAQSAEDESLTAELG